MYTGKFVILSSRLLQYFGSYYVPLFAKQKRCYCRKDRGNTNLMTWKSAVVQAWYSEMSGRFYSNKINEASIRQVISIFQLSCSNKILELGSFNVFPHFVFFSVDVSCFAMELL